MRVMLVDDSPVMRAGLQAMLQGVDGIDGIVTASSGREALDVIAASDRPIDLMFVDVRMPGMDGLALLEHIGDIPAVMLTNADDALTIQAAMTRGARGYLVNSDFDEAELAAAVRLCCNGGVVLGRTAARRLSEPQASEHSNTFGLTGRELGVVDLLSQGLTNQQIARRLSLSEKTVRNVLHAAYAKMCVTSRAEAIVEWLAQRTGGSPE